MGLRQKLNQSPMATGLLCVVLSAAALASIKATSSKPVPGLRYFYDLSTRQVISEVGTAPFPPTMLASGNQGVAARIFACGGCKNGEQFIGYLEKFTDEFQAIMTADPTVTGPVMVPSEGTLVAEAPGAGEKIIWVEMHSFEGQAILRSVAGRCGNGEPPKQCYPNKVGLTIPG